MAKSIYLDYAAATPLDKAVLKAMEPYFVEDFFNPSASYLAANKVKKDLEQARATIAGWLGAKPAEIVFTAGATEANNLAIKGLLGQYPGAQVVVSAVEHESVLAPAAAFESKQVRVKLSGIIDLDSLAEQISEKTVLISIMMVNNELGTIQPLRDISGIIERERKKRKSQNNNLPLLFHTDAAQAPNLFDLHVQRLGVDLMTINGGKIYGPKQSGVLFTKTGVALKPLIIGGGQERGLRSGTENIASAVGLAKALDIAQKNRQVEQKRISELRQAFLDKLIGIPGVSINGSKKHQSPHIASLTFEGRDNERLMMELDEAGIQVAAGSACSAANTEPSHVLSAIGLTDEQARSTLRFSFGRQTTAADLDKVAKPLRRLVA